ncbi:hypothetical protein [Lysobacter sp. CA199]
MTASQSQDDIDGPSPDRRGLDYLRSKLPSPPPKPSLIGGRAAVAA